MASVTVPVTKEGIVVPSSAARRFGCGEGDWARVEITPLLSCEQLQIATLRYALHNLGDAVYGADPVWDVDGWRIPLRVKGRSGRYGHVFVSPEGEVVRERSTSRDELLEALRAEDSAASSAQ